MRHHPAAALIPGQPPIKEIVGLLAHRGRKLVADFGMSGDQPVGAVEEALIDRQGAFNAFPDTGNGEVVISDRGRDEDGPGS